LEVQVGVDVEVPHLDEIEVGQTDQFHQCFHFRSPVRDPGEDEQVDRV
jgi:hypothetical protein